MEAESTAVSMGSQHFVTFTSLEDMNSDRTRTAIASHAAKLRRQRRGRWNSPRDGQTTDSFRLWTLTHKSEIPIQQRSTLPVVPLQRNQPSPLDILGQGRKDPFGAFAVPDIPEIVHEVMDHAVHHFWPGLTPGSMPNPENPAVTTYLNALRQAPLAFYSYMVGTGENYELLTGISSRTSGFSQLCLSSRIEMIKLVNLEIQSVNGSPSDHLLGAIVVLAANYVMFSGQSRIISVDSANESRFRSPLRTAQFIHVYSARPFRSPHTEALVRLVIMKGGCSKITLPGVASVVALCDLVHASQTNSELYILTIDPPSLTNLRNLATVAPSLPSATWAQLPVTPVLRRNLLQAVEALSLVTYALERYLGGPDPSIDFSTIVNARNDAQDLLLRLEPLPIHDQSPGFQAPENNIYEVARLALRIFSNIVLFPMNPAGGTAKILTVALKDVLSRCLEAEPWTEHLIPSRQLMLWALMLGGVQADDDSGTRWKERNWYLARFSEYSLSADISTWDQVQECLSTVLWSKSVLNMAAWEFWKNSQGRIAVLEEC